MMMIYGSQVLRVVRTVMLPSTRSSVHSKFCKRDISPGQRGRAVVAGTHEPDVAGGRCSRRHMAEQVGEEEGLTWPFRTLVTFGQFSRR